MVKKEDKVELNCGLKMCRMLGVVLVLAAIVYIVVPVDFDSKGVVGYVDDFMVFMAAFSFAHGSFQRPERRYIRRQLYMFSSLFALLGLCWIILLAFMK